MGRHGVLAAVILTGASLEIPCASCIDADHDTTSWEDCTREFARGFPTDREDVKTRFSSLYMRRQTGLEQVFLLAPVTLRE